MVLYKRKPVQFVPEPDVDDDQEVWTIAQTGEVFVTYEQYLTRMDFYTQKRFICPITGHSGLSFFDALQSELAGAAEVEQAFPEALKEPILRSVQFQTVSRIDTLVDQIYDKFKNDYYPHEAVTVNTIGGERLHGVVRDKTRFGSKVLPDGTTTKPFSRYFVSLDERPNDEAVVDDTHIFRDRKVFTKSVLRSFIKKTVTREAWNGAPWLVKPDVAERYQIDTRVPLHLRHDTKLAERKQLQLQKRHSMGDPNVSSSGSFSPTGPVRLPELKPAPKSHKSKAQQAQQAQGHGGKPKPPNVFSGPEPGKFVHLPLPGNPFQFPPLSYRNQEISPAYSQPELPPPPPPPKYPIEDLQLPPRGRVRPTMKYLCSDPPVDIEPEAKHPLGDKVLMKSVGPLLETWDTLNVYAQIFKLDSFTFDDFVEALLIASDETPVQLFTEIHCAVLKILVSGEEDGGKPQIQLPELDDEQDEEEEEEETEPSPDPEPQPSARATRSSMAKLEAERLAAEAAEAEKSILEAESAPKHRAEELLNGFNWVEQLAKREFKDGGWEMIMVGLLHQLSKNERQKDKCEVLLQHLVPTEIDPSQETVRQQYAELDINLRVQALQIICMLTSETRAIRGYLEECATSMTAYRKEKIELQRARKQCIEDLKSLNDERKILLPDNLPLSPPLEPVTTNGDVKMSDAEDLPINHTEDEVQDSEDDTAIGGRKLRRAQDRILERKRRAEKEQERKERAEAAAKIPKQSKQFIKVTKDIQKKEKEIADLEDKIAEMDNDLREADCPRTRVLGKDRFWNRYYWFERNGMPYAGLPDSSTADAKYANGCIWVQGPDELEREGYIDMKPEYQDEYRAKFDMTVPERKKLEEGSTNVFNAYQWGFYSEPEEVDKLLDWLDPRGFNELKLRKEIVMYRDRIATHMEARKAYVGPIGGVEVNGVDKEEEEEKKRQEEIAAAAAAAAVKGGKRMSTRGRATAAHTPEVSAPKTKYRCLKWHNKMAMEHLNHLHSEQPAPVRSRKQTKRKSEAIASAIVAEGSEPATTRGKKARQSRG